MNDPVDRTLISYLFLNDVRLSSNKTRKEQVVALERQGRHRACLAEVTARVRAVA